MTETPPPPATPDATQPVPPSSIFVDDNLTFAPDWHKRLPEEFHGTVEGAQNLLGLVTRLKGLRDKQANPGSVLSLPGDKATDAERQEFRAAALRHLGVPDSADGYDLSAPEGFEADAELVKEISAIMPKAGVTKDGAKLISDTYNAILLKRAEAIRAEDAQVREAERVELAGEYKDRINTVVAQAKQVARDAGWPEESMDPTSESFVGAKPFRLIQGLLSRIAKAEGVDRTGGDISRATSRDRSWAERVIAGKEPESAAYNNKNDPDNKRIWGEVLEAFKHKAG